MTAPPMLAFEISIHPRPPAARAAPVHSDRFGAWPTLAMTREDAAVPMDVAGDDCLAALARLDRAFVEPDGSFVWRGGQGGQGWQVDGSIHERNGRVLLAELKGNCPEPEFDRLLSAFGWPGRSIVVQLLREGVWLEEKTFRLRAAAAFGKADGRG